MAKRFEIYRCAVCGNVVEALHGGEGVLFCCGRSMRLFSERTVDPGDESYAPVVERTEDGIKVIVGRTPHAMEEGHRIQWIDVIVDRVQCRKYLATAEAPEALFRVEGDNVKARAYCTEHGLCLEVR